MGRTPSLPLLSTTLILGALATLAFACTDDEGDRPPVSGTTSSTSSSGSTGSTGSTGGPDGGGPSNPGNTSSGNPAQTDLTFDADFIGDNGAHSITGTITLPAGASAGRGVQMEVIRTNGIGGNQLGPAGATGAGSTLTYKVTSLSPGVYKIGVRVDQTDNKMVNDVGDYIGFARGTNAAPKTSSSTADEITITNAAVTGVDVALAAQ